MRIQKSMSICMVLTLFFCGCAAHQKELMAKDYAHMNNDDLLTYYYELSDEISRCENSSSPSVGIGTGFGLGWLGLGLGVSHPVARCNPEEMRTRRVTVRVELQHRGITP